jgi:hypothetical protein
MAPDRTTTFSDLELDDGFDETAQYTCGRVKLRTSGRLIWCIVVPEKRDIRDTVRDTFATEARYIVWLAVRLRCSGLVRGVIQFVFLARRRSPGRCLTRLEADLICSTLVTSLKHSLCAQIVCDKHFVIAVTASRLYYEPLIRRLANTALDSLIRKAFVNSNEFNESSFYVIFWSSEKAKKAEHFHVTCSSTMLSIPGTQDVVLPFG